MNSSFNSVREELEDLEDAVIAQIDYIIREMLTDGTGCAKSLTADEVKDVIRELSLIK